MISNKSSEGRRHNKRCEHALWGLPLHSRRRISSACLHFVGYPKAIKMVKSLTLSFSPWMQLHSEAVIRSRISSCIGFLRCKSSSSSELPEMFHWRLKGMAAHLKLCLSSHLHAFGSSFRVTIWDSRDDPEAEMFPKLQWDVPFCSASGENTRSHSAQQRKPTSCLWVHSHITSQIVQQPRRRKTWQCSNVLRSLMVERKRTKSQLQVPPAPG